MRSLEERDYSTVGIVLVVVNLLISVVLRQIERRLVGVKPVDMSKTAVVLVNNAMGAVLLSPLLLVRQEHDHWSWEMLQGHSAADWVWLLISCVAGVAIGWSAYNVQQRVSATTMFVLTNSNKVLVVAFGMTFLDDPASTPAIVGTTLALGGGIAYGVAGLRLKQKANFANAASRASSLEREEEGDDLLEKTAGSGRDNALCTAECRVSTRPS